MEVVGRLGWSLSETHQSSIFVLHLQISAAAVGVVVGGGVAAAVVVVVVVLSQQIQTLWCPP